VPDQASYCTVARLVRAWGNRGELEAELEADSSGWFASLQDLFLWDGAGRREPARLLRSWPHKNRWILQFEGVNTISRAEAFAGWEVQVPMEARPPAPDASVYVTDLEGCEVIEAATGRVVGMVHRLMETGGAALLEVRSGNREILIPFAASICVEVDAAARRIRVNLPEGLEDLNEVAPGRS
jgi:16S rRNA processing protein RimM